ncbi:MAG: YeeE/YedE thiosulfate transporter family protein [Stappiaceae bacterium]
METQATEFTPALSALGGALIGLSAVWLMASIGRIAGLSGIVSGVLPTSWDRQSIWKVGFLIGAIAAPVFLSVIVGFRPDFSVPSNNWLLIGGGLLVGVGVSFGGGCTSGHGVCGISRLSMRSIFATVIFMATTGITVYVMRHLIGL